MLVVNPLRLGDVLVTGAGTTSTRERLGYGHQLGGQLR